MDRSVTSSASLQDVRERGLVALAPGLRNRIHVQLARLVEARVRLVLGREPRRADLEKSRDADAAKPALALRRLAPRGKALPVGKRERLVHHALELAAVVGRAVGGLVGHRLRRDEVLSAQLDRVEAVLGGGVVDQPLDRVGDVGAPGTAVGRNGNRVRVCAARVRVQRRDAIHPAHGDGDVARADLRPERRRKGAEVGRVFEPEREEPALAVEREFSGERQSASLVVGEEDLRARRDPFHGARELLRGEHHGEMLGVRVAADAEAPADLLGDHADLVRGKAACRGKEAAHVVHALAGRMHGERSARRIELGEKGPRLDRVADHALAAHREARLQRRASERGFDRGAVARLVLEGEVAGNVVMDLRGA